MIQAEIEHRLLNAIIQLLPDAENERVLVRPCADPKHGDYQSNALMALAKKRQMNPRRLADQVVGILELSELCEPVEIAGPGFLNFKLKTITTEHGRSTL